MRWPGPALIGACLVVELALIRVGIDDLDEGYFAQQAVRVLHSQVPFRDFETLYSPGLVYLHASLFALAGGPNLLAMRALALLARAALAFSLYALARPYVKNPLWAALPGVFILVGLDDAPERWEPHPAWLATLFAVLAAYATNGRALLLAGALAALSYAFKQNTGLFMLLAIAAWTRAPRAVVVFGVLTALWLVPLAITVGDLRRLGVLVGAVNQAGLVSPPEPTILVPLGCIALAAWRARGWYLVAGLALFATQYPRMDTLHLAWSAPLLLVVGASALESLRPRYVALALLALGLAAAPILASRAALVAIPRAPIAGVEAPRQAVDDLRETIADIQARTAPGEAIFVYPTSPLLYVLSDRPNATRFDHLNPGAATPTQLQHVIEDLSTVQVVVISDFWQNAWGDPGDNAILEDYLTSHFPVAAQHGPYRVLQRRL